MFTGIVECKSKVAAARAVGGGLRLTIGPEFPPSEVKPGDSIAVNGVCLTVAAVSSDRLEFDVIAETLAKTNLGRLTPGQSVNLERSLRLGDRVEGHWVQGHADATSRVTRKTATAREWVLWFSLSDAIRPYIIPKGSVALDGVSLTVAEITRAEFSVALIPTTLGRTTLGQREVGDVVNVETDLIVRTIVHNLARFAGVGRGPDSEPLEEKLREGGYFDNP